MSISKKVRITLDTYSATIEASLRGHEQYKKVGMIGNAGIGIQFAEILKELGHDVLIVDTESKEFNL